MHDENDLKERRRQEARRPFHLKKKMMSESLDAIENRFDIGKTVLLRAKDRGRRRTHPLMDGSKNETGWVMVSGEEELSVSRKTVIRPSID